jgi:glycopeptide antibiotics resistance protein
VAITGIAALGSATVETLQWVLGLGRVTSIDDVILNAMGAGLAALVSRAVVGRFWTAKPRLAPVP